MEKTLEQHFDDFMKNGAGENYKERLHHTQIMETRTAFFGGALIGALESDHFEQISNEVEKHIAERVKNECN